MFGFIKSAVGKVAEVVRETTIEAVSNVNEFASKHKSVAKTFAILAIFGVAMVCSAEDIPVTLPDTGLNVAGFITAAITGLAAIVAVALGGYVAFLLVKKAMRWIGKALN